jgi:hypothetical protein
VSLLAAPIKCKEGTKIVEKSPLRPRGACSGLAGILRPYSAETANKWERLETENAAHLRTR